MAMVGSIVVMVATIGSILWLESGCFLSHRAIAVVVTSAVVTTTAAVVITTRRGCVRDGHDRRGKVGR